ncbi:MAG: Glu/Leu/Phe/Val dehydrogenase [Thermodesulfobacteriota bacterium]|nr:Glu/Leu/Phe/Val dehydrogenase [Thermodesulfobacteriota bacterium]
MEDYFELTDDLGPWKIIHICEPSVGMKGVLVIDNVACGPAIGGVRMAPDVSTVEAIRLARAMTLKNAAAGLCHGGGKSVIYGDPKMDLEQKEQLIRAFACSIKHATHYIPGPDMGTDEMCMAWTQDETGRAVGLPREIGGIPLDELGATGFGLSHAVDVALDFTDFDIEGARIVVQGFGSVGKHAARFLAEKGAILVGAADSSGSIYHPRGLDIPELMKLKAAGGSVTQAKTGVKGDRDAVIDMECEIWIPAARPDVIHGDNVQRLQTKLIVQGANIPFTEKAERILHKQGVLVIPDFIANAGGVICAAVEYQGESQSSAFQSIEEKISTNTRQVLEEAAEKQIPPRDAAVAMAECRVRRAMDCRRWSLF